MTQDIYVLIEHACGKVLNISYIMLAQARQLAAPTGGQVIGILLGHQAEALGEDLDADAIWYVDHPLLAEFVWDNYLAVLEQMVAQHPPRLFLLGETTIGSGVAGGLSARLGLPLLGSCRQITAEGSALRYTCQICGGKMMAEGLLPDGTALVTMIPNADRLEQGKSAAARSVIPFQVDGLEALLGKDKPRPVIKRYIQPETGDVDITRETILVSVGRGIQQADNLGMAEDLAEALGGAVSASRPIIDQGWLPSSRLVGKSGKTVKPRIYLALGISGAPEHAEAIGGVETIIAVNTDPAAPIFNLAKYGAEVDILDLLPALTERVKAAK